MSLLIDPTLTEFMEELASSAPDVTVWIPQLHQETGHRPDQIRETLKLLLADNTIPFIARYRKEATGGLDEVEIANLADRFQYLRDLDERRQTILKSIREQEKLTPELEQRIQQAETKQKLEDLYLPYKPKRRTRATIARDRGLEPLADLLAVAGTTLSDVQQWLQALNEGQEAPLSEDDALQGARDIWAERLAEIADLRNALRERLHKDGRVLSQVASDHEGKPSKFEAYYDFSEKVSAIAPHRYLAIRRGEKDGILRMRIELEEERAHGLLRQHLPPFAEAFAEHASRVIADAWQRLLAPTLETDVRVDLKLQADEVSIDMFGRNLRQLLLQPPGGAKVVIGLDPGFRTGTKWVVIDETGRFLDHGVIYPVEPKKEVEGSRTVLRDLLQRFHAEIVAVGNGTASREVHQFVREFFQAEGITAQALVVNESGASVYSASSIAREEFPDLDLTVRGAVSIARRYQDPLAELVKIDPKSIGVGQYQHDVNQTRLKQSLDRTVESCVNFVGVDLNRASASLLGYVSGISSTLAKRIVSHRNEKGGFQSRQDLLTVSGLGPKTFEQAAGFLRIPEAGNPLDRSAVHPENYALVERMAQDHELTLEQLVGHEAAVGRIDPTQYAEAGAFTVSDILQELKKPGRDPRKDHQQVEFDDSIQEVKDLKPGMRLNGIVTNITHFGAFIDIGVHQDGLAHISQLSDKFVKDPMEAVTVGQAVQAWVLEVDEARKRISLSLRSTPQADPKPRDGNRKSGKPERRKNRPSGPKESQPREKPLASGDFQKDMAQLMAKFNKH